MNVSQTLFTKQIVEFPLLRLHNKNTATHTEQNGCPNSRATAATANANIDQSVYGGRNTAFAQNSHEPKDAGHVQRQQTVARVRLELHFQVHEGEVSEIRQKHQTMLQKVRVIGRIGHLAAGYGRFDFAVLVANSKILSISRMNLPLFMEFLSSSSRDKIHRYENLKGKYFEIKRAQMNGEQRPYWLYYNEMDYIISHFPGHRPRINVTDSIAATSTPNASANATPTAEAGLSGTQSPADFTEIKPSRASLDNSEYFAFHLKCFFL